MDENATERQNTSNAIGTKLERSEFGNSSNFGSPAFFVLEQCCLFQCLFNLHTDRTYRWYRSVRLCRCVPNQRALSTRSVYKHTKRRQRRRRRNDVIITATSPRTHRCSTRSQHQQLRSCRLGEILTKSISPLASGKSDTSRVTTTKITQLLCRCASAAAWLTFCQTGSHESSFLQSINDDAEQPTYISSNSNSNSSNNNNATKRAWHLCSNARAARPSSVSRRRQRPSSHHDQPEWCSNDLLVWSFLNLILILIPCQLVLRKCICMYVSIYLSIYLVLFE